MSERRVVITGLGPVASIGVGANAFWEGLLEGRQGIHRVESFDPSGFNSQIAGEISSDIKVKDYVPKAYRRRSNIMARDIEIAVIASHAAITDSGLVTKCLLERGEAEGEPTLNQQRFGANIGAGLICANLDELSQALASAMSASGVFDIHKWGSEGMQNLTPLWLLKFLPNMLACHVTIVHQACGPSNTITCGEASSHLAIGEAFRTISFGKADVCICGGAESKSNPMALIRQSLAGRLSQRNDDPNTASRPFAVGRDGMVVSEGGGLVILEELEHARARGARIYCELVGFGASNDAYTPSQPAMPHPEGRGAALAINKAIRDAGVTTDEVSLMAPFGASLQAHDLAESHAIHTVFGERGKDVPVMAIKGTLGNNGAGSGALDLIAAVLAIHNNTIPGAVNSTQVDPECGLNVVAPGPTDANLEVVVSSAYALGGGQNAALVLKRFAE
jgi:3-oxoacyl-[acyl-carrier-protein] synthase II